MAYGAENSLPTHTEQVCYQDNRNVGLSTEEASAPPRERGANFHSVGL